MIDQIGPKSFRCLDYQQQFFSAQSLTFFIAGELADNTLDASMICGITTLKNPYTKNKDKAQRQDDRNAAAIAGQLFLFFL